MIDSSWQSLKCGGNVNWNFPKALWQNIGKCSLDLVLTSFFWQMFTLLHNRPIIDYLHFSKKKLLQIILNLIKPIQCKRAEASKNLLKDGWTSPTSYVWCYYRWCGKITFLVSNDERFFLHNRLCFIGLFSYSMTQFFYFIVKIMFDNELVTYCKHMLELFLSDFL